MEHTNNELFRKEHGAPLAIEGYIAGESRRVIAVQIGTAIASCICPVTETLAQVMVDEFYKNGLLPQEKSVRDTVANLIQNCSAVYTATGIEHFLFDPVYVNAHGYNVTNARIVHTQEKAIA